MNEKLKEYEMILANENDVLDSILLKQTELKDYVTNRNWEKLITIITEINMKADMFNRIDTKRDELSNKLSEKEMNEYQEKITILRSKLTKSKIQNETLSKYISITRGFIQSVVENAIPQARSKIYSKTGIVQNQPQSVVLDKLF